MPTITHDQFVTGTGLTEGTNYTVTYPSGITYEVVYYPPEPDEGEVEYDPLTLKEFRTRFGPLVLAHLDKLQDVINDDAKFLEMCPSATAETIEPYRSFIRSTFKSLYAVDVVYLDSQEVKDGMGLLLTVGAIDQMTHDNVLDVSSL